MASFKRKHRLRQADPDSDPKQSQSALEQQEDGFLDKATCQPMQLAKALSKQKMKIKPANEILKFKKDLTFVKMGNLVRLCFPLKFNLSLTHPLQSKIQQ